MITALTQDVILHAPLREGIPVGLYVFGIAAVSYIGGRIVGFSDGARWGRSSCERRQRRAQLDVPMLMPPKGWAEVRVTNRSRPFNWGKDVKPSVLKAPPR